MVNTLFHALHDLEAAGSRKQPGREQSLSSSEARSTRSMFSNRSGKGRSSLPRWTWKRAWRRRSRRSHDLGLAVGRRRARPCALRTVRHGTTPSYPPRSTDRSTRTPRNAGCAPHKRRGRAG
jgi:hypothetical protein